MNRNLARLVRTAAFLTLLTTGAAWADPQAPTDAAQPVTVNTAGAPRLGPERTPVTIVVFADFAEPECGAAAVVLKALLDSDPERVALVFKHRPAPDRPERVLAHYAAVAAGAQERFWEMFEVLMANQRTQTPADLARMAAQIGLDGERFVADVNNATLQARVAADVDEAGTRKIAVTPSFVINGQLVAGRKTLGELKDLVADALARRDH